MSEQIIVDRTTTWHAIGKSVERCKDFEGVLLASGLDYTVEKYPISTKDEGKFMMVTFHPGLMNVILQSMAAVGVTA